MMDALNILFSFFVEVKKNTNNFHNIRFVKYEILIIIKEEFTD